MSVIIDFGALLDQISHDFKNHLGIIETLLQDIKLGHTVDTESMEDALLTLERIHLLSKSIQRSGTICRKTDQGKKGGELDTALEIIDFAIQHSRSRNSQSVDKKLTYVLELETVTSGASASRLITGDAHIRTLIRSLLVTTDSLHDASARTLVSIFRLTLTMSGISECILRLKYKADDSEPLFLHRLTVA
jgi:hypothetical protein